ncbi:hypothetical protein P606_02150 [Comamonas thiooxydans]|nr:hypothetical protein P606_02150 [Comamonas thiooxydans]
MATTPRKDLPGTNAPNWSQRVTEELRVLMGRGGNGRALTAKDLIDSGIAKPGAGGGLVPGVPGGGDTEPDLTPPPMPTGFAVTAGLTTVFVEHDAPGYTQGHGHDRTVVYGVLQTASTAPTFDQAVVLFQFQGTIGAYPAALGTRYRLWIKWQSQDGVQSVSPAGGINGLDVQTGKIGNNDLGPLIVEAGNLANGSVSASKLAAQAVDATKFANGIEPVTIITGTTLPTTKSTSNITFQGQLYTWNAATGKYETAKFDGSIGGANLLKNAALIPDTAGNPTAWAVYNNGGETNPATLTLQPGRYANRRWAKVVNHVVGAGTLGIYQTPTPYLQTYRAGQKYVLSFRAKTTTPADLNAVFLGWNHFPTTMTWLTPTALIAVETLYRVELVFAVDTQAELYISASPVGVMSQNAEVWITEPQLEEGDTATAWAPNPADILPGSITAVEIADNSITAPKLIAEAVTAGKIAANAVSAYNLQALAVTAGKIAADAVTAGTIAAGAISAREIAAGAVTTDKLVVTGRGTALNPDPQLEDVAHSWTIEGPGVIVSYGTGGSATSSRFFWTPGAAAGDSKVWSTDVLIDPSRTYRLTASLYTDFGNNRDMYIFVQFYDQTGAAIPHNGWGGAQSGYVFGGVPPADWSRQGGQFGAGVAGRPIPANARSAKIGVWFQYTGPGGTSSVAQAAADIRLELAQDASLIVDGAIVATKLAANSIAVGTAAIQDGAIVNAMIGNLSADKINAGTLNAARIAAGTISSSHLAANSVIAGKIAANAVTAGTIAANAVTATQIAAGAITVDKLAAGSVTADKLTVGVGGNLCPDSTFTPGLNFWRKDVYPADMQPTVYGVNMNADWAVNGSPTAFCEDTSKKYIGNAAAYKDLTSSPISVIPGERYEASVFCGWHRCRGEVILSFFDANGNFFAANSIASVADGSTSLTGGKSLSSYYFAAGFVTVPAGAVTMRLHLRAGPTSPGQNNCYAFYTRPFVGRANPNQTEFTSWSPSANTQLLPDGITTPSISALAGKFGDIEIRPTAGASGCIRVYDANGALRVRLGVW